MKNFFYRVFCGFFLGLSVFAPGFSGSVIAIVLGVYQDLLRIASNPFKKLKQNILFCLPLGIGAALSAVLFVFVFEFLFKRYEKAAYLLFVGLIAGNLPVIFKDIRKCGFKKRYVIGGAIAFAAALAFGLFTMKIGQPQAAASLTAKLPMLALGGLAGGAVALMPGMSVTMVFILLGVYSQLLFMAKSLLNLKPDFSYALPFGLFFACAIAGLVLASQVIKVVFEKYPGLANAMVFGFMAGSLISLLTKSLQMQDASFNWLLGGLMLAAGLGVSMLFVLLGRKMEAKTE